MIKLTLLIAFFCLMPHFGISQVLTKHDSTEWYTQLENAKANRNFKEKEKEYILGLNKSLALAKKINVGWRVGAVYDLFFQLYFNRNNDSANYYSEKAMKIADTLKCRTEEEAKFVAGVYNNKAASFGALMNFTKAIEYTLKSMEIYDKAKLFDKRDFIHLNIAQLYLYEGDFENALIHAEKTKRVTEGENLTYKNKISNYYLLAFLYSRNNKLDSAKKYLSKGQKVYDSIKKQHLELGYDQEKKSALAKAQYYLISKDFNTSISYCKKILEIAKGPVDSIHSLYIKGLSNRGLMQNSLAYDYLKSALKIAQIHHFPKHEIHILNELIEYDPSNNSFHKKSPYLQELLDLKEKKIKDNYEEKIYGYEINKRERAIWELEKDKKIDSLEIAAQKKARRTLYIVITVIILIVIGLIISMYALKLANKKILIKTEQLNELKTKIARYQSQMNPHFIFNAMSSIQANVVRNDNKKAIQQIADFAKLMRTTLNNSELDLISLTDEQQFLQQYLDFELRRFTNKIDFKVTLDKGVSLTETQILPMLIQPLIENSLKHAGLSKLQEAKIEVNISVLTNDTLEVIVSDNGVGFTQKEDGSHVSKAMAITKERVKLFLKKYGKSEENCFNYGNLNSGGAFVRFVIPYVRD